MSKKKSKNPQSKIDEPKPFRFMNSYHFEWNGTNWHSPQLGPSHIMAHVLERHFPFVEKIQNEFGYVGREAWCTIEHAENQIIKCASHPVLLIEPEPLFLRKWLDEWVELQYCRMWQHIFHLLLGREIEEFDAAFRADEIGAQYEALYEPTFPRVAKKPKPRRGSKKGRAMSENPTEVGTPIEPTTVTVESIRPENWITSANEIPIVTPTQIQVFEDIQPEDLIELHGPHPSPLYAFDRCYRILNRGDPEPDTYEFGERPDFFDGSRIIALIAGNDPEKLRIAADIAYRETKRRVVYERLKQQLKKSSFQTIATSNGFRVEEVGESAALYAWTKNGTYSEPFATEAEAWKACVEANELTPRIDAAGDDEV